MPPGQGPEDGRELQPQAPLARAASWSTSRTPTSSCPTARRSRAAWSSATASTSTRSSRPTSSSPAAAGPPPSPSPTGPDGSTTNGEPRFKVIVEGANLFITQQARLRLEEKGVVLYKDASANKGGVTSSHLEVLASLALTDEEWDELMCVKDGKISDFRKKYVAEDLDFIRKNAALEFEVIWKENARTGIPRSILSDLVSEKINRDQGRRRGIGPLRGQGARPEGHRVLYPADPRRQDRHREDPPEGPDDLPPGPVRLAPGRALRLRPRPRGQRGRLLRVPAGIQEEIIAERLAGRTDRPSPSSLFSNGGRTYIPLCAYS